MPTVNLNLDVFEKLVGKKLPLDKLKDRISMLGTDLECIEDKKITVEVFPNRPDMLSEQGFARAFSSFIGVHTGLRSYKVKKSGQKVHVDKSCSMREYAACAIIKNIKFDDERIREVMQIQEKLAMTHGRNREKSCYGLYPLKAVKFPIKYVAKSIEDIKFKPLGFNVEMSGKDIEDKHPTGPKYKWIAENWKKYPCYTDSNDSIMSMLPYTNSNDTGKIDERTTEVFIECTGTDMKNVEVALNIFCTMLSDIGGEVYSVDMVYGSKTVTTPDLSVRKVKCSLEYVNKILGLGLSVSEFKKYLERMGYGFEKGHVLVPPYRADILHQIDFAEDVAIAYGFENFKEEIPNVMTIGQGSSFEDFKEKIAEIMVGLGLIEISTNHITSVDKQSKKMNVDLDIIEISNSVSVEHHAVRSWIIPNLLEVLSSNKHNEYPQNIFNIGIVFKHDKYEETNVEEVTRLGVGLCGERVDFTSIRQVLQNLFDMLDLKFTINEVDHSSFISGRVGRVICEGKKVAFIGEVNPVVLSNWEMEYPVSCFELNLTEIFSLVKK